MEGDGMAGRTIRVLLAISGQDANDRGGRVVALALRGAGIEVIYSGAHRSVDEVAAAALQENVDVVVLGVPPGAHLSLTCKLLGKLEALGIRNGLKVAVRGAIPPRDVSRLRKRGVEGIFPAGTSPGEIVAWVGGSPGSSRTTPANTPGSPARR